MTIYRCGSIVDGQLCVADACAAYYAKYWRFVCAEHVNEVEVYPEEVRKTLFTLADESAYDLMRRSLPGGEDR
jgi:hypothetical protein